MQTSITASRNPRVSRREIETRAGGMIEAVAWVRVENLAWRRCFRFAVAFCGISQSHAAVGDRSRGRCECANSWTGISRSDVRAIDLLMSRAIEARGLIDRPALLAGSANYQRRDFATHVHRIALAAYDLWPSYSPRVTTPLLLPLARIYAVSKSNAWCN